MKDPISRKITSVGCIEARYDRMIHFGINPVSGGSPAKDSSRRVVLGISSQDFDINEMN
jgi:hypothetical protein